MHEYLWHTVASRVNAQEAQMVGGPPRRPLSSRQIAKADSSLVAKPKQRVKQAFYASKEKKIWRYNSVLTDDNFRKQQQQR